MTDDCMGCREPGDSHAAYCPESRVEDLRKRLADSERLREDERLTWDAQHKRQASMNAHLAALVTDAQEELRKCQQDAIQLQARLAEAERNEGTLLGMIHHQRDVLRECLPYLNESMAGKRPGRCADDIRAAVKALTADRGDERNG